MSKALDLVHLRNAYLQLLPNPADPAQRVSFGTSGHRGTATASSFNEAHILAITQAICEWRKKEGITGPLFMGKDTHALSTPAEQTALQVLVANSVHVYIQSDDLPTPTPVISHAILTHNAASKDAADGIVVTPSHNPPQDGGFKYNESHGGPADTATTKWIEKRANELLQNHNKDVLALPLADVAASPFLHTRDYIQPYIEDLASVINMEAIAKSRLHLAVDPMGGAGLPYWEPIAKKYGLDLTVVNKTIDPTFSFMPLDHDGIIRMDCSSPAAMANLLRHAASYDLAFANDPDTDRHGIVTPAGLMNPNHFLSVVVWYLLGHRPLWNKPAGIGKTVVTTHLIDKICQDTDAAVYETPVGFKWFVEGLHSGAIVFGGEESAGASFLRFDGSPWTTDKDGIILNLLAAEIMAVTGKTPAVLYDELTARYGAPAYTRKDAKASLEQKKALSSLDASAITADVLAGSPVLRIQTTAAGNDAPIGGLKVVTKDGWFAARPSGTEALYKIYAESFRGQAHLEQLVNEAQDLVNGVFAAM